MARQAKQTGKPPRNRSAPKARPRGRPRGDDMTVISREALLEAALKAFAEVGYEGMSMRELSRRLGISHSLLNIRFGSKSDLWQAAVDHGVQSLAARIDAAIHGEDPEEKLRNAAIGLLEALAASPSFLQLINYEGSRDTPRLAYIRQALISRRFTMIDEIVVEGVRKGVFRKIQSSLVFLLLAHGGGAVFGLKPLARSLGLSQAGDADEIRAKAGLIADVIIRGLKT